MGNVFSALTTRVGKLSGSASSSFRAGGIASKYLITHATAFHQVRFDLSNGIPF
jgi:hypothetical protein